MKSDDTTPRRCFEDTIAAIITPPGQGGIAALRLAGPRSKAILAKHFHQAYSLQDDSPFRLRYGEWVDAQGAVIDDVTAVHMPEGQSYTGLEQVEVFCHGGAQVTRDILRTLLASGARPAEPGEFTKLAFLNGRIDLVKAEAVAEIIAASTEESLRVGREHLSGAYSDFVRDLRRQLIAVLTGIETSIDFSEEDIPPTDLNLMAEHLGAIGQRLTELMASYEGGRIVREGFRVAIAGRTNAGKSTLFNRLLRQDRAIVSPLPGTTRDYLSEWIDIDGYPVNLIDTAGHRDHTIDQIEAIGQRLMVQLVATADLTIWVIDATSVQQETFWSFPPDSMTLNGPLVAFINKIDLMDDKRPECPALTGIVELAYGSCVTGEGIDELRRLIRMRIERSVRRRSEGHLVTSARHARKFKDALTSVTEVRRLLADHADLELAAFELRQATNHLAEITGEIYTEEILGEIFSKFCVGK
jgi:tRNA modification GTPase